MQKFCYTLRFIDDLTAINNKNFEKNIQNIYPVELILKKRKQVNKNACFSDLNIDIQNSKIPNKNLR